MKILIRGYKFKIHFHDNVKLNTYIIPNRKTVNSVPVTDELLFRIGAILVND